MSTPARIPAASLGAPDPPTEHPLPFCVEPGGSPDPPVPLPVLLVPPCPLPPPVLLAPPVPPPLLELPLVVLPLLLALPLLLELPLVVLPLLLAPLELLDELGIGLHWSFIPAASIWQPHWQRVVDAVAPFWQL
jgi:hypothetical protein